MKANELRIGNYVEYPKNTCLCTKGQRQITVQGLYDFFYERITEEYIKPIPLTEEWLLKFGFEKYIFEVDNENQKTSDTLFRINVDKFDTIIISISKMFSFPMLKNKDGQHYYLRGITSVHQLQNLYFALTGEELTIE